jgi:hypothetical protein
MPATKTAAIANALQKSSILLSLKLFLIVCVWPRWI